MVIGFKSRRLFLLGALAVRSALTVFTASAVPSTFSFSDHFGIGTCLYFGASAVLSAFTARSTGTASTALALYNRSCLGTLAVRTAFTVYAAGAVAAALRILSVVDVNRGGDSSNNCDCDGRQKLIRR